MGLIPEQQQDRKNGKSENVSVHWFRHGLRLHDNPALLAALENCEKFYPIFIFDGEVAGTKTSGYNRWRFLHESLEDLDESFRRHGGRLYVFHGDPVEVFNKLIDEWSVTTVTFEQDPEPIWQERDNAIKALCDKREVAWIEEISHTLWDPREIIENNGGQPPLTYAMFNRVTKMIGRPSRPMEDPDFTRVRLPLPDDFTKFALPPLSFFVREPECEEQLNPANKWIGGETQALKLLQARLKVEEGAFLSGYTMPNQYKPDLVGPPASMSPHLRFGCLSIRKFYWGIHDTFEETTGSKGNFQVNLTAQLIWREYFYTMSVNNPMYNKMEDNPICLQIPWYSNEDLLHKWTYGETGYPWIDACMKQLMHEGWIHHTARHAVSCFLTRGDLWLSWEDGLKVFDRYLLDADWSVCAGNWMWVSSSAFENCLQCPKCFSPVMYGMHMDPSGEYIRRYLPVLRNMPLRYLFQPWKAPKEVQEKAGCVVGKDYPAPIVNHKEAASECKQRMEEVKAICKEIGDYCAPSNSDEVRKFCFLPDHMASGSACRADFLCEGIEGL